MADLHVDDDKLKELLERAVSQMLSDKKTELDRVTIRFLDDAEKAQREILGTFDMSKDRFESKARERLTEADAQLKAFIDAFDECKKKAEDALNLRIIGGFSAVLLVAALIVISVLAERVVKVNETATALSQSAGQLKASIESANIIYKQIGDSAKGTDFTSQLQTLSALTTRIDGDIKRIDGQIENLNIQIKPLQKDYDARHPRGK
jgi:chaperonin cofactor prefoldin